MLWGMTRCRPTSPMPRSHAPRGTPSARREHFIGPAEGRTENPRPPRIGSTWRARSGSCFGPGGLPTSLKPDSWPPSGRGHGSATEASTRTRRAAVAWLGRRGGRLERRRGTKQCAFFFGGLSYDEYVTSLKGVFLESVLYIYIPYIYIHIHTIGASCRGVLVGDP